MFDEVLVSPKMLADHLPDVVAKALDQLSDRNYQPTNVVNIRKSSYLYHDEEDEDDED